MDLHYSQTAADIQDELSLFESPMDLHYSQTLLYVSVSENGLNPLWIYTTLKHGTASEEATLV